MHPKKVSAFNQSISTPPAIGVVGRAPAGTISINTVPVTAANRQGEHFFGEATETTNPNGKWNKFLLMDCLLDGEAYITT